MGRHLRFDFHNYDVLRRPVGPYKWHSQFFALFFVRLSTWGYIIGVTPKNIDSQAQVEYHSITGVCELYMGRHLGIDFHRSEPPVKLCDGGKPGGPQPNLVGVVWGPKGR